MRGSPVCVGRAVLFCASPFRGVCGPPGAQARRWLALAADHPGQPVTETLDTRWLVTPVPCTRNWRGGKLVGLHTPPPLPEYLNSRLPEGSARVVSATTSGVAEPSWMVIFSVTASLF